MARFSAYNDIENKQLRQRELQSRKIQDYNDSSGSRQEPEPVPLPISWWPGEELTGPPDDTPGPFTFIDITNAVRNTSYESIELTITGINVPSLMTISGGQYSVNSGSWASVARTVTAGDKVKVRGTSSPNYSTPVNVTLTIGGVTDTLTITTGVQPV